MKANIREQVLKNVDLHRMRSNGYSLKCQSFECQVRISKRICRDLCVSDREIVRFVGECFPGNG